MGRFALLRLAIAAAAAAALVLGPVGSASAHDVLVGTTPAEDGAIDTAPASVSLEFSEAPQSLGTAVVVTGPDGAAASEGAPEISGSTVVQQLSDGLPAGTYTVDWRATSADGHPLTGSFAFDVTRDAPAAAPAGGEAASPDDGDLAPASSESSSFPVVWIVIALIAAVAVVLVVRQLRRPT
jgi:methionine-rich copper-binding protein CopC